MISEPDAAGTPTFTLRTNIGGRGLFQIWCRGSEQQITLLTYDGENSVPGYSADVVALEIDAENGRLWTSPADFYRHSEGWFGLRYRNAQDARAMAEDIVAAKSAVGVTMVQTLSGVRYPYSASAKGSTKAGRQFIDSCFGAPAVPSVLALPAWELRLQPDEVNGGQQAKLLGDLDQGGYFFAVCDGLRRVEVSFLSDNPSTFPYATDDLGLTLRIEIDGETRSAVGEGFVSSDGVVGIRYAAPDHIESLLAAIKDAKSEVAVTIESYSSGMVTRWPAMNMQGLASAAGDFYAHCFGTPNTGAPM
jgi:hypothetical protein